MAEDVQPIPDTDTNAGSRRPARARPFSGRWQLRSEVTLPPLQLPRLGGRLPLREVTLLWGDGGVGKGMLTAHIAALLSQGRPLYEEEGYLLPLPEQSLVTPRLIGVVTLEDSPDVWHHRFNAAGGDEKHLVILNDASGGFSLKKDFRNLKDDWDLIVVDPAYNVLDDTTGQPPNTTSKARSLLRDLQRVAGRLNAPMLLVHHINSRGGVAGGPTWIQGVRSALFVCKQSNGSVGVFHKKANHTEKFSPMQFDWRREKVNGIKVLDYLGVSEDLEEYIPRKRRPGEDDGATKIEERLAWLMERLTENSGQMERADLYVKFDQWLPGMSDKTLQRLLATAREQGLVVDNKNKKLIISAAKVEADALEQTWEDS